MAQTVWERLIRAALLPAAVVIAAISCTKGNGNDNGPGEKPEEGVYYAAPNGRMTYPGTIEKPMDIYTAVTVVKPGETIFLLGGVYNLRECLEIKKSGTASKPIRMEARGNEKPEFDFRHQDSRPEAGVLFRADWWYVKGLSVGYAYREGFMIGESSHLTFDQCSAHHNGGGGFKMGFGHGPLVNTDGQRAAYNTFINCDAHHNCDWWSTGRVGTNTDGFVVGTNSGKGNVFRGCRGWSNSDDNWDLWECGFGVQFTDCWCWSAGVKSDHDELFRERMGREMTTAEWAGDGNGFKFGGGCFVTQPDTHTCRLYSRGTHIVRNCVAFNNRVNGFDQNQHHGNIIFENCLGFNNGGRNFTFYYTRDESKQIAADAGNGGFGFRNNISFGAQTRFDDISIDVDESNSWNGAGFVPSDPAAQFVSLTAEAAAAERDTGGSLPSGFARPAAGSFYLGKGVDLPAVSYPAQDISLPAVDYPEGKNHMGPYAD